MSREFLDIDEFERCGNIDVVVADVTLLLLLLFVVVLIDDVAALLLDA